MPKEKIVPKQNRESVLEDTLTLAKSVYVDAQKAYANAVALHAEQRHNVRVATRHTKAALTKAGLASLRAEMKLETYRAVAMSKQA